MKIWFSKRPKWSSLSICTKKKQYLFRRIYRFPFFDLVIFHSA